MRALTILGIVSLLALAMPESLPAAPGCAPERERLAGVLGEGIAGVRKRMEEVKKESTLAEATRADFVQRAEWLIAWLRDQVERMSSFKDCTELPRIAADAHLQVLPVALASWKAHATVMIWHIDDLLLKIQGRGMVPQGGEEKLSEARELLRDILERGTGDVLAVRRALRHGTFLLRQALRLLRIRAIMEGNA